MNKLVHVDMMHQLKENSVSRSDEINSRRESKIIRGVCMILAEYTQLSTDPTCSAIQPEIFLRRCSVGTKSHQPDGIRLAGEVVRMIWQNYLAEAAAIYDKKNATQTQSYGPEARGGASKAEVVIDQGEIDHPEVIVADVLVAMSQEACDKYAGNMKKGGLLIVDQERVGRVPSNRAIKVPITRLAEESSARASRPTWLPGSAGGIDRGRVARRSTRRWPRARRHERNESGRVECWICGR
jgi:hypothetical protein